MSTTHDDRPDTHARELSQALGSMTWRELPQRFSLLGVDPVAWDNLDPELRAGFMEGSAPRQLIREDEVWTVLLPLEEAKVWRAACPGLRESGPWVWLRFEVPMDWGLVGFLAHITGLLAKADVSVGAVCGYDRDHLFVAESQRDRARGVLRDCFGPEQSH